MAKHICGVRHSWIYLYTANPSSSPVSSAPVFSIQELVLEQLGSESRSFGELTQQLVKLQSRWIVLNDMKKDFKRIN